jgi:hypothetical protein
MNLRGNGNNGLINLLNSVDILGAHAKRTAADVCLQCFNAQWM